MAYISRRHLLKGTGALGFTAGIGALSSVVGGRAWAADVSGYKALVCIFLKGGLDHGDTVLPYDQTSYDQLVGVRQGLFNAYNSTSIASSRNRDNLLNLNPANAGVLGGREIALPPELAPLQTMFDDGDLAILGNVGPLVEPTTRAQFDANTVILPPRLFSHNDQQSVWMSFDLEGRGRGWGGLFADAAIASSPSANPDFFSISVSSNDVFLSGNIAKPYKATSSGASEPYILSRRNYLGGRAGDDDARALIRQHLERTNFGDLNIFSQDIRTTSGGALQTSAQFLNAWENETRLTTAFAGDSFSQQLKTVAETIKLQSALNAPRQIFYVSAGGFDTHDNQAGQIGNLHTSIANSLTSFKAAMQEIGQWNNVTAFTMSDFGRTLIDNGDGTDHGWGAHHFIAGGQVDGGRVFGDFPSAEPGSGFYTPSRGRLIPTTSVEQYAATLGQWFGLNSNELAAALPNLSNFNDTDLGFLA